MYKRRLVIIFLIVILLNGVLPVSYAAPRTQVFWGPLELAVWDRATGDITILKPGTQEPHKVHFGQKDDLPVPGSYNGPTAEGYETVFAVWRPSNGTWYFAGGDIFEDSGLPVARQIELGQQGDIPVPADYDGDGTSEVGVWHPATGVWTILDVGTETLTVQTGQQGDVPLPGDYDGDGKDEIAVWRPADHTFYISLENKDWSGNPVQIVKIAGAGEIAYSADFDNDATDELGVWHQFEGRWTILRKNVVTAENSDYIIFLTGQQGDVPIPADYNGDGAAEAAVWRPAEKTIFVNYASVDWATAPADKLGAYPMGVSDAVPVCGQYFVEEVR